MAYYQVQVYTQKAKVFDDKEVVSIIVPGEDGYLGVMAHHTPLVTTLGRGKLTIEKSDKAIEYRVAGGFLEVGGNRATLLVDELELLAKEAERA
ncbi:MAG: F0F1 ATP synthase subunit epsilon [bacterium]|nr:F0F1 ATP synthase subunit epsilon [bacterium]